MAVVYVHINKFNNLKYFGMTNNEDVETRWGFNGEGYRDQKFYTEGIKIFGWDSFIHKKLISGISKTDAFALEAYLIEKYDTINNGYNVAEGYCSNKEKERISPLAENIIKQLNEGNLEIIEEESLEEIKPVGYTFSNQSYPLRVIKSLWDNNQIDTELDIQRGLVWSEKKKQELWDSLLYNARIPEVHARKEKTGNFSMMDGKQRLTNCMDILDDKIPLKITTLRSEKLRRYYKNRNISSLVFSQLSPIVQERILSNSINFAEYINMSDEEMADLFRKLNNGEDLSEFQKIISQNFIFRRNYIISVLRQNEFLKKLFPEGKHEKNDDEFFLVKTLALLTIEDINLNKVGHRPVDTQKLIEMIENNIPLSLIQRVVRLTDLFEELNITSQDFERENKKTGQGKRISESYRPFIFAVFANNLDKKKYFKTFLKEAILPSTQDDRLSAATVNKYYRLIESELFKISN